MAKWSDRVAALEKMVLAIPEPQKTAVLEAVGKFLAAGAFLCRQAPSEVLDQVFDIVISGAMKLGGASAFGSVEDKLRRMAQDAATSAPALVAAARMHLVVGE